MTPYLTWLTSEQSRLHALPRPIMSNEAYHDWLEMLARDMPAQRIEWWIERAIEDADIFPHRLFQHCPSEQDRLTLAKYFPEAWEELKARGAEMMAEFEHKHCYLTEWKQHGEMQLEKIQEEAEMQREEQRLLRQH